MIFFTMYIKNLIKPKKKIIFQLDVLSVQF
jgi:hypothetical protein